MSIPKYCVDHGAFSVLTPEAAYWAGFLAADGNLRKTNGKYKALRVYLGRIDHRHLVKLQNFLGSAHKVAVSQKYNRCSLELVSEKIYDDLCNIYKLSENKSLTLQFPELPENLLPHFVRGYFEGDGCICEIFSSRSSKKASLITRVLGAPDFMTGYREVMFRALDTAKLPKLQTHPNGVNLALKLNTEMSVKFLKWIYEGSTEETRLDRKYEKYVKTVINNDRLTR